ncbi:hypothetical protein BCR35DRAFT_305843 [Leucosporidium creatinivorum]|uniref:Uncharacterized protein n=1 Tax=Leucosporidium creatinivorum TaxID=106004 RepID=A0A1Y2EZQ2_9BASI|nr:hypothetical protein BCR35DRAFT_305843 [Leucosporidium creatinivorum]
MDDDDPAFDFGSWCVVCGRLVEPPASTVQPAQASTSASSSPAHSPALSTHPKPKRQGSIKRNKSSSKLHHGHSRTRSGVRLNQLGGLGPSTQIHKGKDSAHKSKDSATADRGDHSGGSTPPLKSKAEQEAEATAEEELSSLYCSLECQREDQAGAATATNTSPLVRPTDPRRHSSSSSTHSATSASSPLNSFAAVSSSSHTSNDSLPGGLDFSTRRNSRGATYRPLSMSRTLSNDQGAVGVGSPAFGLGSSRGSSSSLVGLGEEERSGSTERTFARPLSSLSALRGMTPIPSPAPPSPTFPPSLSSPSRLRPAGGRTQSDKPPSTARFASPSPLLGSERDESRGRREDETPEEREMRKKERRARSRARREANGMGIGMPSANKMAQSVPASLGLGLEELHLSSLPTRPSGPSPISRTPNRSSSSASLALMSSSFSKSYSGSAAQSFDSRSTSRFLAPKVTRSESTASLSGLNATGTILPPSASGPGDISSPSTFIPPPPRPPLYSPTHPRSSLSIPPLLGAAAGAESSSPSSTTTSSFTNSHQSAHSHSTSHSSRSYLSSSAGSGSNSHLAAGSGHRERGRTTRGLQMTPSSSSLAAAGGGTDGGVALQRSASGHDKSRTPKKHHHPPPPDRAASTPATIRRPSIYQTAPTPSPHRASSTSGVGSPARPSALQTPSLSYLTAEAAAEKPLSAKQRNFSWDSLGVKAYHSLDLDEVRAAREEKKEGGGAMEGKAPALGQQRAKKKLFHFAMDDEE